MNTLYLIWLIGSLIGALYFYGIKGLSIIPLWVTFCSLDYFCYKVTGESIAYH